MFYKRDKFRIGFDANKLQRNKSVKSQVQQQQQSRGNWNAGKLCCENQQQMPQRYKYADKSACVCVCVERGKMAANCGLCNCCLLPAVCCLLSAAARLRYLLICHKTHQMRKPYECVCGRVAVCVGVDAGSQQPSSQAAKQPNR